MNDPRPAPETPENPESPSEKIEESRRRLLKSLATGAYVAPVTLAMMTTKASACSLSC